MTTPGGDYPDEAFGPDLSGLQGLTEEKFRSDLNTRVVDPVNQSRTGFLNMVQGFIGGVVDLVNGLLEGAGDLFDAVVDLIFGTVNNEYVAQLPVVSDHTSELIEVRATVERMILQGDATIYTGSGTHHISEGISSVYVIAIGGGGGGAGGVWNLLDSGIYPGGGGGGGGEIHVEIPVALVPDRVLNIEAWRGGYGGAAAGYPGTGGGDVRISTTSGDTLVAGGGDGGFGGVEARWGRPESGGSGMIRGGQGGHGAVPDADIPGAPGGDSVMQQELHGGGGGGGGGGSTTTSPGSGGQGGISRGGRRGSSGASPAGITATGGGGGGGAADSTDRPNGGYPGGGGGGGYGNATKARAGGAGANGIVFVLERV